MSIEPVDSQVADLNRSSVAALIDVEQRLADLRLQGRAEWTPALRQSLERLWLAFGGVMECVRDPRFPVSMDAASASQFSQTVNGLQGFFTSYPNDAPNIVPGAWQQVAVLGSILRGAFIGTLRGTSSSETLLTERAVGRVQQLGIDLQNLEKAVEAAAARHVALGQDVSSFIGTMNNQFLERQTLLEREWRDSLTTEREVLRTEVERLRESGRSLHAEFDAQRVAALAALEAARNGTVERLNEYERQAREALGAVGSTAQSAQYQATADAASTRAVWWQVGAVASMLGAAGALLFFVLKDDAALAASLGGVANLIKRALFVATLGILSRYCAAMAEGARREKLWAHQRAVELRALAPYLEAFPPEARLPIRERLVDRYFGAGSSLLAEAIATKTPPATATHDAVLSLLERVVADAAKKASPAPDQKGSA
jgi:hypothetical protein